MFDRLYDKALAWSRHRHASRYLSALSFAESSFFPVPPDVMLAPMSLSQPSRATHFALLTTLFSVLGGILGYFIGHFFLEAIEPLIQQHGYTEKYEISRRWFADWGVWAVFLAGFSPIPYKIFTITAGALGMPFIPFLLASIIGRGARFFLLAYLIARGGPRLESGLRRHINRLGWGMVIMLLMLLVLHEF